MTVSASVLRATATAREPAPLHAARDCGSAVLVLRALGLGDALTAVPALRGIRRAWPDRWILLAGDAGIGAWLRELGLVDEVLPAAELEPLAWPPPGIVGMGGHVAVNLHGRGPQSHRILAGTAPERLIGFRQPAVGHRSGPAWSGDEHEVLRWCRLVTSAGGSCGPEDLLLPTSASRTDAVVVHPGAAAASRRWPAERWARVAARIAARGCPVELTGSLSEVDLCDEIVSRAADLATDLGPGRGAVRNRAGTLSLADLADLVAGARLLLSGDTGVAHLATAFATRSVLLFGPTAPSQWGPIIDPELHTVLWHGRDAHPGDPHGDAVDPALAAITVDEVLAAADPALAATASRTGSTPAAVSAPAAAG